MAVPRSITIVSPFFYPEDTAIGLYTTQFARFLVESGHNVTVLTGFPNYPQWEIHAAYKELPNYYTETAHGIRIIRYKQYVPKVVNFRGRILMMLSLMFGALVNLRKVKKSDLVICIVPYTLNIIPSWLLARLRHAKIWIHVQDFEFDLAIESGVIGKRSPFSSFLKRMIYAFETLLLNRADIASSISNGMLTKFAEKSKHKTPYYFPNWVSSHTIDPGIAKPHAAIDLSKFTLLYSGNVGEKQNWDFLHTLCERIKTSDDIEILIVGDGGHRAALEKKLKEFPFIRFNDPVPYEELNDLLCSGDAHFLFQKTDIIDTLMPSKILGMMASGRPSIVTGNAASEVATIFRDSQGGAYFSSDDPVAVYNQIIYWKNHPEEAKDMGKKARSYITNQFSDQFILGNFNQKIEEVCSS